LREKGVSSAQDSGGVDLRRLRLRLQFEPKRVEDSLSASNRRLSQPRIRM